MGSSRRWLLNQATHCSVASSTASLAPRLHHGVASLSEVRGQLAELSVANRHVSWLCDWAHRSSSTHPPLRGCPVIEEPVKSAFDTDGKGRIGSRPLNRGVLFPLRWIE